MLLQLRIIICLLLVTITLATYAQRVELVRGKLKILKKIKDLNIEFVYDSLTVGVDLPEGAYLKEKQKVWNEKQQGKGEEWVLLWFSERQKSFEPAFKTGFKKYTKMNHNANAQYTMILRTTNLDPGWTGGVMGVAPQMSGKAYVVDSADKTKPLAIIQFTSVKGRDYSGGEFEIFRRIAKSYEALGIQTGYLIKQKR